MENEEVENLDEGQEEIEEVEDENLDDGQEEIEVDELEELRAENAKQKKINKDLEVKNKKNYERLKKYEDTEEVEVEMTEAEEELMYEDPKKYAKLYAKKQNEALKAKQQEITNKNFADDLSAAIESKSSEMPDFKEMVMYPNGQLKIDHIPSYLLKEWEAEPIAVQLEKAYTFLKSGKVANPKTMKQPNLSKVGKKKTEVKVKPKKDELTYSL